jgi:hypothetical protein
VVTDGLQQVRPGAEIKPVQKPMPFYGRAEAPTSGEPSGGKTPSGDKTPSKTTR